MSGNFAQQQFQKQQFKHSASDLQEKSHDYDQIRGRLKLPANGLIATGALSLLIVIGSTLTTVVMSAVRAEEIKEYWVVQIFGPQKPIEARRNIKVSKAEKEARKQRQSQAQMVVTVGVGLIILAGVAIATLNIIAMTAGVLMKQAKNYKMVRFGCIIAMIPLISPLVVLGIPFGILGLIKINNADIKPAFR